MTGAGTTTIAAGTTVTLPSATVGLWDTRVLENAGTVLVASADRGISFSGTPRFVNQATGILRKTVGSSTATATTSFITVPVENDGKVESVADTGQPRALQRLRRRRRPAPTGPPARSARWSSTARRSTRWATARSCSTAR